MADQEAIVRGAASVLDVYGAIPKDRLDFTYNGKHVLAKESAEDEIQEALVSMGALMAEFIADLKATRREKNEGHE